MCQWLSHVKVVHGHCLPNWQSWQSCDPWQWVRHCLPNWQSWESWQWVRHTGWPDPSGPGTQAGWIPLCQAHRLAGCNCVKPTGCRIPIGQADRLAGSQWANCTSWPTGYPDPSCPGPQAGRISAGQAHRLAGSQLAKHTAVPSRTCLPSAHRIGYCSSPVAPDERFLRPSGSRSAISERQWR